MKSILLFLGGIITGIILTILFLYRISTTSNDTKWFETPGEIINEKSFEVFQVLDENAALVYGNRNARIVYLLINEEGNCYYDNEIVHVPNNSVVRQVGIYKYETRMSEVKTVPIVQILQK